MSRCEVPVSPRTGQMISTSYPCGKPAGIDGRCSPHRRAAEAKAAQQRAERAPATLETMDEYTRRLGRIRDRAEGLLREAALLGLPQDTEPFIRGADMTAANARLRKIQAALDTIAGDLWQVKLVQQEIQARRQAVAAE